MMSTIQRDKRHSIDSVCVFSFPLKVVCRNKSREKYIARLHTTTDDIYPWYMKYHDYIKV